MTIQRTRPAVRPGNPNFSSGPCAKRPGWSVEVLQNALLGRSHRSGEGKARLREVIDRTRALLGIPEDYRIGIVAASDTGAVEMAMWSMLGARAVDMLAWESFGKGWVTDVAKHLKLDDMRLIDAPYGELPDLGMVDPAHDVVFTWNGTTSGVRVPDGDWIDAKRGGLTICDATSAVFAMNLPVGQARCHHLVLAESDGRRSAARHARPEPACGQAAGDLPAALAAAEAVPDDEKRRPDRRDIRGRDDQYALNAVRRRRARCVAMGRGDRRAGRHGRPIRGQSGRHSRLDRKLFGLPLPGRGSGLSGAARPFVWPSPTRKSPACRRRCRGILPNRSPACWRPRASLTISAVTGMRRPVCASGADRRSKPLTFRRFYHGSTGHMVKRRAVSGLLPDGHAAAPPGLPLTTFTAQTCPQTRPQTRRGC